MSTLREDSLSVMSKGPEPTRRATVTLQKPQDTHCAFFYDLHAKPQIMRALGTKVPIQATDWRRMIQGVWDGWKDLWVVKDGPFEVGQIGLHDRNDHDRRAEVLLVINPTRHRRGIGREALRQVVDIAERDFGLDLLIARMRADNVGAMTLFESLGFKETGQIRRYYLESTGPVTQTILSRYSERVATGRTLAVPSKVEFLRPETPFKKLKKGGKR